MSEAQAKRPMSDAEGVAQLVRAGVDVSAPVELQFLLRFPSEEDSFTAASRLEELAFSPAMEQDEARNEWVIVATKRMYPVESDLAGLRIKLNAVAKDCHGAYEGWRAAKRP